jgi:hypothetical protein
MGNASGEKNQKTWNEFSITEENQANFIKRFFLYQKERFPLVSHGALIASFSFSAISYSLICRGENGFVDWRIYLVGVFTTVTLFLLLRIFDEFKDAKDDAKFRKSLPVPRGLISFKELTFIGITIIILQLLLNLIFFPKMLLLYMGVIGYLLLMGKEFFIADWLKKHQFWYVTSHMFIIPLIDIYASGLDWLVAGVDAPKGLLFFLAVSYLNGVVIEIGRKIRIPEKEEMGVLTYTSILGTTQAVILWLIILFSTFCLSVAASFYAGYGNQGLVILGIVFLLCCIPALVFLITKTEKGSKTIELTSAIWTIIMYLSLGGIPMLQKLLLN